MVEIESIELTEEEKEKFCQNNAEISKLLKENEIILKNAGYDPPVRNFAIKKEDKIKFPSKYVREASYFIEKYHLKEIIASEDTRKNTAYALQLSDLYNFLINRFYVFGSIEVMLLKYAFINIISIIEVLTLECTQRSFNQCKEYAKIPSRPNSEKKCNTKDFSACKDRVKKDEREHFKIGLEKLIHLKILNLSQEEKNLIVKLYDLRNHIHIRAAKENELKSEYFTPQQYEKAIIVLKKIDEQIYLNLEMFPYYEKCGKVVDNV